MATETLKHIKGFAQLQRELDKLPAKIETKIMRGALRSGASVMQKAAKAAAPVAKPNSENARLYGGYMGALRDSIRVTTSRKGSQLHAVVKAGGKNAKGADVYYAHMVEFGTSAHKILPSKAKVLSFGGVLTRRIDHPGAIAKPFMRPAMDGSLNATLVAVGSYIKKRLTKEGVDTTGIDVEVQS